jgi:hypothetical protein
MADTRHHASLTRITYFGVTETSSHDPDDFILDDLVEQLDRTRSPVAAAGRTRPWRTRRRDRRPVPRSTRIARHRAAPPAGSLPGGTPPDDARPRGAGPRRPRDPRIPGWVRSAAAERSSSTSRTTSLCTPARRRSPRKLYARREAQCPPERPSDACSRGRGRTRAAGARFGGAPAHAVDGGAAVPVIGWLSQPPAPSISAISVRLPGWAAVRRLLHVPGCCSRAPPWPTTLAPDHAAPLAAL